MFALKFPFYPKKFFSGASFQGAIGDFRLLGQVLGTLDGRHHPLHGEEGSQVSCVGGYDDQGEEPPDATDYAAGERPGHREESQTGAGWRLKGAAWSCRPIISMAIYPQSLSPATSKEGRSLSVPNLLLKVSM